VGDELGLGATRLAQEMSEANEQLVIHQLFERAHCLHEGNIGSTLFDLQDRAWRA
jgi:hypothetical protein